MLKLLKKYWDKTICRLFGHRWIQAGFSYYKLEDALWISVKENANWCDKCGRFIVPDCPDFLTFKREGYIKFKR